MTNYFIKVLNINITVVNVGFVVISITAPTLGTVFGGWVTHKIGGYDSPLIILALFIISICGIFPSLLIPFQNSFWIVCALLWNLLFFGGGMVPGLTGLIMSSVI